MFTLMTVVAKALPFTSDGRKRVPCELMTGVAREERVPAEEGEVEVEYTALHAPLVNAENALVLPVHLAARERERTEKRKSERENEKERGNEKEKSGRGT